MKKIFFFAMNIILAAAAFAQKQTFDVVSYISPKGWQQQKNEAGIQLSFTDKKTGDYAIAVITKATASGASAGENFNNDWLKLVKGSVQINGEPIMQAPANENGWNVISGGANYTDGANTGMATLLTATAAGQYTSVVLMTNSKQYQNILLNFTNSLELAKPSQVQSNNSGSQNNNSNRSSVVGLWVDYNAETSGAYFNGMPQYTAGFTRKEYAFYPDGTYLFRTKQWLTTMKEILWIYETGTYAVSGNQFTINPQKGKGE